MAAHAGEREVPRHEGTHGVRVAVGRAGPQELSVAADDAIEIPVGDVVLDADLTLPPATEAVVVFAHGTGSGRHSPRNRLVASTLSEAGLGTLLMDLLTPDEGERDLVTGDLRFDIGLLGQRMVGVIDWLAAEPGTAGLAIGTFGASTGAAAALTAAAERPDVVRAVVSRGGRPDLAGEALGRVRAPTLLIVGSNDTPVIALNRDAMRDLSAAVELEIVPGATHLFEEPGALERVAALARDWFVGELCDGRRAARRRGGRMTETPTPAPPEPEVPDPRPGPQPDPTPPGPPPEPVPPPRSTAA